MTDRDRKKLVGVNPKLITAVDQLIDALAALGFTLTVTDGLRTTAQQKALYAKGRTLPGPIVTYADGVVKKSLHQTGRAVDCAFRLENGSVSWDLRLPWKAYGACAEALGLTWGGSFAALHDLPHVELPSGA